MRKASQIQVLLLTAAVSLTVGSKFSFAGSVSAVKSRLMQASEYIDNNRKDDAKDTLDAAEKFLDGLTDDEKAPLVKQIADLRAKLGAPAPTATNTPAADKAAPPAAPVDDDAKARIVSNLDRSIRFAQEETNPNVLDGMIESTQQTLDNDDTKKALSADSLKKYQDQLDAVRAKMKAAKDADAAQRLEEYVSRMISAADGPQNIESTRDYLAKARGLLDSDDVKQKLDATTRDRLGKQLADTETKVNQQQKQDALSRAEPALKELEEMLTNDPFKGVDPGQAYKVSDSVNSLEVRVKSQLSNIPADDIDVKSYLARVAAAQQKMDGYDAAFAAANTEIAIQNNWKFAIQNADGWDGEKYAPGDRPYEIPKLDKTENAAKSAKDFLQDKETTEARQKGAALPKAAETIAMAEKTLADANAKLDAAFNLWMDTAEKQPRPQGSNRFDIGSANAMAHWADQWLAGSKYQEADVARAKKLDQKWKDELAAIEKEHEAALKQMTADADTAWPKIASSIRAETGFHPADVSAAKDKTFKFNAVRNRTGWDFDGQYDLVIWVDGQPVAGMFDPKINDAFAKASQAIGDMVPDHVDWDVIAVIESTGTVNRRFTTEIKDDHMNVLGKIEGTRPMDCVIVKVIAIHAGPVAVKGD